MALLEDSLIAHYKMNENTAGDNAELVTNGTFAAWTADDPDDWTVFGESGADPEVSEVGTGEGHGGVGTGYCNIYTSDATYCGINQVVSTVAGRKYKVSINVDTVTSGSIWVSEAGGDWSAVKYNTTGLKSFTFVATSSSIDLLIRESETAGVVDVTFDNVSVKLLAIEDSSGNDHDAVAQQDSDAISVAGKINTALEFNGTSDYIIVPDHANFTPALTPFSISAWMNMDDGANFWITTKGALNVDAEWWFYLNADKKLTFLLFDESIASCFLGRRYSTALTTYENQWIHLVATYDGGTTSSALKICLNGIRVDDIDAESANAASFVSVENLTHDVWIGRQSTEYANGTIDNVMFFSKELTALEIQLLYNSGAGVETIPIGIHLSRTGQHFSSSPMN